MVESRCGLLCSKCRFREKMNCATCIHIKQPYWGECAIKTCCESKRLENCGSCSDFPCELLNQTSYDKEYGDNGKRIEQCRTWCGK